MPIAFRYAARSHTGLVRQTNQDSGYAGPHLLVVADGMGGHAAGDVASSIAIGHLAGLDDDTSGGRTLSRLESAIAAANDELSATTATHPEMAGMGTTVTALLRTDRKLAMAHIGDSRAYLLRDDELTQITKDHTYVQRLVDEGRITAEEADHHPQGNLVTRVLTGQEGDEPDVSWREARAGDRYLLCSDGVCGYVGRETLGDVLGQGTPQQAADRLIDLALRAGAPDNATAIVADVVSLTDGPIPSQAPQVVGAAAVRRIVPAVQEPRTPAEKAAALTRAATGAPEQRLTLAEDEPARRPLGRLVGALAAVLVVLTAGGLGFYAWTRTQFFLGPDDGKVAIFRGLDQSVAGIGLSSVAEQTDVSLADLPTFYRTRVDDHVAVASLDEGRTKVAELRQQTTGCAGLPCVTPPGVTPSPSFTVAPSGSPTVTATVTSPPVPTPAPTTTPATTPTPTPAKPSAPAVTR